MTLGKRALVLAAVAAASCSLASNARAAFDKIDDFEGRTLGPIGGQGFWTTADTNATNTIDVEADPQDEFGKSLHSVAPANGRAFNNDPKVVIANNTTGTLFVRFLYTGTGDIAFGMSDIASPTTNFGDFELLYNVSASATGNTNLFNFRIRDGGTTRTIATDLLANNWYGVWSVIDNTNDVTSVFLQGSPGSGSFENQTQLSFFTPATETTPETTQTAFKFRNSATSTQGNNLVNVLVRRHNYFIDDIFVDQTGENLNLPISQIPEPATTAMLGAGGLALLLARRRRNRR